MALALALAVVALTSIALAVVALTGIALSSPLLEHADNDLNRLARLDFCACWGNGAYYPTDLCRVVDELSLRAGGYETKLVKSDERVRFVQTDQRCLLYTSPSPRDRG